MSGLLEDNGFVIHSRRYRENSRIIEVFTREHGRVALIARVSTKRGGRDMAALQPFHESFFHWRGRNELQNLVSVDAKNHFPLDGENGICGFYGNELILYLLAKQLPCPELYESYRGLIKQLAEADNPAIHLRHFEAALLNELGFSLNFELEESASSTSQIYYFHPENGFSEEKMDDNAFVVTATVLSALAQQDYSDTQTARAAKTIFGATIQHLLEGKKLRSRELMQSYRKYQS